MKSGILRSSLVLAAVFLVGLGTNAFAGWGRGHGWQRGGGGYGYDCPFERTRISEEDRAKLDQERQAFFKQTEDLRTQIADKERDLLSELEKQSPDAAKASELQKTLSDLYGQFDQKRLDHRIRMRQINPNVGPNAGPNAGSGYMRGSRMDRGPGMMDRGPGRGAYGHGRGFHRMGMGGRGGNFAGGGPCW